MGILVSNAEIEQYTDEAAFLSATLNEDRPRVLRGGVAHWRAVATWTPERLVQKLGDRMCQVAFSSGEAFGYGENPVQYERHSFREAVAAIADPSPSARAAYLMQQSLDLDLPELRDDVESPSMMAGEKAFPFFWFGRAGNVTPVHFDGVNNLFGQVRGRKRFTIFSPSEWNQLYPRPLDAPTPHLGMVDVERPDWERFPEFRNAHPLTAELDAGDLLYLPAFWWHHVRSLDEAISVNFWWAPRIEQCLTPAFLRQIRVCYQADRLVSLGAPFSAYPGGYLAAARRALELAEPTFAVLLAGAAMELMLAAEPDHAEATPQLRWLMDLAEPVAAGRECGFAEAHCMLEAATAFEELVSVGRKVQQARSVTPPAH